MRMFSRTRKLQVATIAEGALLGRVDDFQFDLETGEIFGWRVKGTGVFAKTGGLPAAAMVNLGRDVALVRGEAAIEWGPHARSGGDGRSWGSAYLGTRVVTRRGAELGRVEDFVLEADPPRVRVLLLDGGRIVPYGHQAAVGKDAVILDDPGVARVVPDAAVDTVAWWEAVRAMLSGALV